MVWSERDELRFLLNQRDNEIKRLKAIILVEGLQQKDSFDAADKDWCLFIIVKHICEICIQKWRFWKKWIIKLHDKEKSNVRNYSADFFFSSPTSSFLFVIANCSCCNRIVFLRWISSPPAYHSTILREVGEFLYIRFKIFIRLGSFIILFTQIEPI